MLTRLVIRNFKRFDNVEIELGNPVVFIGPNNSGKTTALQALALWDVGRRAWSSKRKENDSPKQRPGVTINRKDLLTIPVPAATLLWKGLHVRAGRKENGRTKTANIRIEIELEGETDGQVWTCGFEFDYSNEESLICRPLRLPESQGSTVKDAKFSTVPSGAADVQMTFLPSMSGLISEEPKLEPGRINVLLGQGQTAQVLRNLCYEIFTGDADQGRWCELVSRIQRLFGVQLDEPVYNVERGEITMSYCESEIRLDLSSSGRGLQQTLLTLALLYRNPRAVLLLDEPDAHLEILRQREVFKVITEVAATSGSQVVAASHSEQVLKEAADTCIVVAFLGRPHRINEQGSQLAKSLRDIGWEDYYQAEQAGWVLYLEGETDHLILTRFAELLQHPALKVLDKPFLKEVGTNLPQRARDHFYGLKEAKPDLVGIAIFDRIDRQLQSGLDLQELSWSRREVENYFCNPAVFERYARRDDDLFSPMHVAAMQQEIRKLEEASQTLGKPSPWSADIKASDEVIPALLRNYYRSLEMKVPLTKRDYCDLVRFVHRDEVDPEIIEKLDAIVAVAARAVHPD